MAKENISRIGLKTILVVLVLAGLGFLCYTLYNQSMKSKNDEEYTENFVDTNPEVTDEENESGVVESFVNNDSNNNMDYLNANPDMQERRQELNFPKEQLGADDLLPKDNSSLWAQVNPAGEGTLKDRNFLQSGYHIGINTVGQTLRNANQQLRSEPPNPQVKVSPWLQTTIEPDLGRKPMEIGGCA